MNAIRCKMKCQQVTKNEYGQEVIKLTAVYGGDKNSEDNTYSKATPSATFELTVDNPAAHGFYIPGKAYYFDSHPATPATTS